MTLQNDLTKIGPSYRKMADVGYRPGADSDGYGNIVGPLDLEAETLAYARRFLAEDAKCEYHIGTPDFQTLGVMPFLIEAARLLCGGSTCNEMALKVMRLAVAEMEAVLDDDGES